MKKAMFASVAAILLISSFSTIVLANPPGNEAPVPDFSSGQILVKFKPDVTLPEAAEIHRQLGGDPKETIPGIEVQVVTVPKGQAKDKVKAYSSNPRVAYAEPDFVAEVVGTPDDPSFGDQWGMITVQAAQAWDVTTGSSVNIAILDTGVDLDHPDLADKIVSNVNFSDSPTMDDVYGHGTHVAGIAAASTNNGIGVAGLGYDATIMNVKVLGDTGRGAYSSIADGIIWAADNGADIINMSLGGTLESQALQDAINYAWSKGVVVVAAAGNNGKSDPFYPAAYASCVAVAATDAKDEKPLWSNYGNWVDVAAPGRQIYSTLAGGAYEYMSGTSMASPHVAGLAALVLTTVSDTNGDGKLNDEVRSRIETTCDDVGLTGIGYGRINAARAVGGVPVPPGTISGQVTDARDGSAISGVRVSDGIRTYFTDSAGKYTIDNVPPGSYQVVADKEGYEAVALAVEVLSGATVIANFSLYEVIVPGTITGSVTDVEDGSPIVGVVVSDGTRTTTTDTAGEYTIADVPPGNYEVTASKEGYESSSLTVAVLAGNSAVANFSLSEITLPSSITGSVTDAENGSPIAAATVTDGTRTATTDSLGKYTIAAVPAGIYEVTASKEGYESSSLTVTVSEGATAVANLSLNDIVIPGTITGKVADAKDGAPIAGAVVSDGTRTTITDATGKYTIADVPPGTYQVTASKSGYYSSSLTVTVLERTTTVADLSLSEIIVPGTITGTVTDAKDGAAIAGVVVSDGTRTTTTDATGKYTIVGVPPGTYQVTASKSGYHSSSLIVTVLEETTTVADFSLSEIIVPGTITGTVSDAKDGSPIVGAVVSDGTRTTTTDATGKYTIVVVPPGTYQVTASKSGYYSSSLTVTVLEETTTVAGFSLSEIIVPGTITGTVTNAKDGAPIVGAVVSDGTRTTTTDATGKYTIADVPPGTYQISASKAGYESSMSAVTLVSGGTAVVNFSLNQNPPVASAMWVDNIGFVRRGVNLFIEVRVLSATGVVPGAEVGLMLECSSGETWNFTGTTDTAGLVKFKLGKAPDGSYWAAVTSLTCNGFTWDASKGITAASYALSR